MTAEAVIDRVTLIVSDLDRSELDYVETFGCSVERRGDTASNDIVATHSVVRVASLDRAAAALARHGAPLAGNDLMTLDGGILAALVRGPDGHRFLAEERSLLEPVP
jgi:catechol 2,3-dioxygenase-like lactoylglutathione lyase family enzyme